MELTNILTCNLDKTPVSPSLQLGPQNKSKNVILGLSRRPRLGDPVYMAVQSTYRVTDTLFIFGAQSETTHNAGDLTSHHVGQGAVMREVLGEQYVHKDGIAIAVPKAGHTKRGTTGRLKTASTNQVINLARDMGWDLTTIEGKRSVLRHYLARDIRELRRVYPDISNSTLKEVISLNYAFNPIMIKPK